MINSRQKGKVGELELAQVLRANGHDARRGVQYKGSGDSPDVIGLEGFHIECKRVEKGSLYAWLEQAEKDSKRPTIPLVLHRRSRKKWVAILSLDDFLNLVKTK